MSTIAQAQEIVDRLVKDTRYASWTIAIVEQPLTTDDEPAAQVNVEIEEHRAQIQIDPRWQTRTILNLEELMAHEVGHIVIDGPLDFVAKDQTISEAEERLASRIGMVLLEKARREP